MKKTRRKLIPLISEHQISFAPEQAAALTGRSRSRIFKAIRDGELQARKDGRATLLLKEELIRWVKNMPKKEV